MQLLGAVIFIGILVIVLVACVYLANTQKTPSLPRRSIFTLDTPYHRENMNNAREVLEKLDERSLRERRRHPQGSHRHQKLKHERDG